MVFPEELVGNDRGGQKLDQWTVKQLKSEKYDAVRITWNKTRGLLHLRQPNYVGSAQK
ncbi:hypothetical protein [Marinilabilia salmonicolor]|uniref:hypothetical protein n=1 Tax=Marinilabilia salmonicolor TaxID=989 RepID=UPI000302BA59|nr:hypothetical protein [Marinilabilia salmonicolor]